MWTIVKDYTKTAFTACKQALQGALAAGRENEGEPATMSLEFEIHLQFPCDSLPTELSDFYQSGQTEKECKCKKRLEDMCRG